MATSQEYAHSLQHEIALAERLGLDGISWLSAEETRQRIESPRFCGAWWDPRCVLLNPAKLAWGMKRVVKGMGARIVENTPVMEIRRERGRYILKTPGGTITAEKISFATNAFGVRFPHLRAKQVPVYTHIVLTEPLGERLESIGWRGREGIEDERNLIHYFRLTADNRLLMGGGDISLVYGSRFDRDYDEPTFEHLQGFVTEMFPSLAGVRFTHRWGGPVSVTADLAPALGYLGAD